MQAKLFVTRSRVTALPGFDSEEDVRNPGVHTFTHTHMRKAFMLMNELRRSVHGT